jgi:NAD(P)-dependent dehydrogenase (short-subunit alcohol dehydrogenase family)
VTEATSTTNGIAGYNALVTGGGSGIGLGTAIRLVRDGAHVTICGRTEAKLAAAVTTLDRVAADTRASGGPVGSARYVVADVTEEEQIAAAVVEGASPRGHLDILFANAGGSFSMGPMVDADVAGVRATIDLNLVGTFLCIKHGAPLMDHRHVVRCRTFSSPLPVGLRVGQGRHRHVV